LNQHPSIDLSDPSLELPLTSFDTLVIGGGVVGMSLAYGLARAGERVALLDQGDDALRAARGNFGLVWVQGKGLGRPPYARWTVQAARQWPALAAELRARTGVDVELSQPGGLSMCLSDDELAERAAQLTALRADLGGDYAFDILDASAVRALIPETGPDVVGAVWCPLDGHVNPLRVLRAFVQGFEQLRGVLVPGVTVQQIEPRTGGFIVHTQHARFDAQRVVLAAGLGNRALAPMVGLKAPVSPNRGQILVTERLQPFLKHPTLYVRQTGEGILQLGDSKEDVGLDDHTTLTQLSMIAARAIRCFPLLETINIVRTWGALRVMSPDGFPIYQASEQCPGAFVVTCHSGITLAAQHAGALVDWIRGAPQPQDIQNFHAERFDVQAA
jgi:glycine/D-amino acid oxidase-like deaminating enzyme